MKINATFAAAAFLMTMAVDLASAAPLGTAFTYQGRLADGTNAASNLYDLDFALFDVPTGGSQLGMSVTYSGHPVSNGWFTVTLDFGASAFNGDARWLQLQVRTNGSRLTPFTSLNPRQPLTPSPNALHAANAGTALATAAGVVSNLSLAPGAVTSDKIADGTLTSADLSPALALNTFWRLGGNAGTLPGAQFLGTTDNLPVELKVNGQRALRLEPGLNEAPNVVGGSSANAVAPGVLGATVAGGGNSQGGANTIQTSANFSTLAGGYGNTIQTNARLSFIGGGGANTIQSNAYLSTIVGGSDNVIHANAKYSIIAGGEQNTIFPDAYRSTIGGGSHHRIESNATNSTIGGGSYNVIQANAWSSTVAGGDGNLIGVHSWFATIGGGLINTIRSSSWESTIGGGWQNDIGNQSFYSAIGGGIFNTIGDHSQISTIAGGASNYIRTNAENATIGGGGGNIIEENATASTIGGGNANRIETNAAGSTISGGIGNRSGGSFATVPGGRDNSAVGSFSLAAGQRAKALHDGAFVWADRANDDYASTGTNQFCVRATGGVQLSPGTSLYCGNQTRQMLNLWSTNYGIGVQGGALYSRANSDAAFLWYLGGGHKDGYLDSGGGVRVMSLDISGLSVSGVVNATAFNPSSDRNLKENFTSISPREVLDKVAALPISRWNFKGDAATPHAGPMAQDFHAAFGLGTDDKHIATVDADGVALAAIQGLNEKLKAKDAEIQKLNAKVAEIDELKRRLAALERSLSSNP